jgi:hypothetical protein
MVIALVAGSSAVLAGGVMYWTHHRRLGSGLVNSAVNPWLLRHGLVGGRHSEIGSIEHVGRVSGIRRLTPIHPEATSDGFRVMVPIGFESQWARNVIAAGHCRLLLHGRTHELADPQLLRPRDVPGLPRIIRLATEILGFRYLTLRTVAAEPPR